MNTQETTAPAGDAPNIVALPEPSFESQIELLTKERDDLMKLILTRNKTIVELQQDISELNEQINQVYRANPLVFAIMNMANGAAAEKAANELRSLCDIVAKQRAKGVFSLKIAVKPFAGKTDTALTFELTISTTPPKPDPELSLFFMDSDGGLTREEHRQRTFTFKAPPEE